MKFLRKINLEINKDLYNPIQVKQGDNSRYLLFNLLDNGVPFSLENKTVRVYGLKPDGTKVFNNLTIINAARGLAELQLTTQMLVKPGCLKLELVIYEATDILSTTKFDIDIISCIRDDGAIESTNEFSALTVALAKADEYGEALKQGTENIELIYATELNRVKLSLEEKANITARRTPLLYGHRCFEDTFPECTISALRSAVAMGQKAVEVDLRQTKDKVIVVLHDDTLDRTTNGTGSLNDKTWDEIRNLDCGSWFSEDYIGERIPTLDVLFQNCSGLEEIVLQIADLDDSGLIRLVDKIKQYNLLDKALTYTAERYTQRNIFLRLGEIEPKLRRAHGIDLTNAEHISWIKEQKGEIYLLQNFDEWTANTDKIQEMVNCGFGLICSTTNMEKSAQALLPYGINRFLAKQMWGWNQ